MENWFGKGCVSQCCQWEEKEWENPAFKESMPVLIFCSNPLNPEDTEGNCNEKLCPITGIQNSTQLPDLYQQFFVSAANVFSTKGTDVTNKAKGYNILKNEFTKIFEQI